jgi:hypothetical protein
LNLILWVLYTGRQWKGLPVPHDAQGKPAMKRDANRATLHLHNGPVLGWTPDACV